MTAVRKRGQDEAPKVDPPPRPTTAPAAPPPSGGRANRCHQAGTWPGARRFLAGTWTIWRIGGGVRLVLADLRAGIRWAVYR